MMDGPVDAVWIENLNTVLDDNKKLCLSSGEIVKFTPLMTMMFEVEDLLEASPATVSRCGMVYLDPEKLGWQVLLEPWIKNLPAQLRSEQRDSLYQSMISTFATELLSEICSDESNHTNRLQQVISVPKNCMFLSFLRTLESLLLKNETRKTLLKKEQEQRDKEETKKAFEKLSIAATYEKSPTKQQESLVERLTEAEIKEIHSLVVLSAVWSFGGTFGLTERQQFSKIVLQIIKDHNYPITLGDGADLYQHFYFNEKWIRWDHSLDTQMSDDKSAFGQEENGNAEIDFRGLIIPTEDTIRQTYMLQQLIHHSFPVVFLGETGTGKTSTIKTHMASLSKEEWEQGQIVFSATTTALQIQGFIQSRLEKQKKGVYGPKVPGHRLAVFIDDLNMPAKEKYGAQPPIEVLRQIIDNGGYYDLKTNEFIKLVELVFIGAMGLPGGGRSIPTARLLRHFNVINIPAFSKDNLYRIFSQILEKSFLKYPQSWQQSIPSVTKLSIALYENAIKHLLPLPAKSHYLFNLRQVAELIHGLTLVPNETVRKRNKEPKAQIGMLQRLWVHESMRVFSDRLINEEDQSLFLELVHKTVHDFTGSNKFPFIEAETLSMAERIIFNNFVVFEQFEPIYQEASQDLKDTQLVIQQILELHAQMNKDQRMNLLMFDYMIQHLSRISRIIHKPNGNGVLIGLGGNGRKTLSKLASFINDCNTFKVDIGKSYGRNDWQDDLKTLFKSLSIDNKKTVFMFSDSDIKGDYFIEDISSILNVGEVPNLFTQEELDEAIFEMQKTISKRALIGDAGSESNLRDMFTQRCRKNFHLLLLMSPAGSQLRQYIRQYPALVNCTSIDWFLHWPREALTMVASHYLEQLVEVFPIKEPTVVKADAFNEEKGDGEMGVDIDNDAEQTYVIPLSQEDKTQNDATLSLRDKVMNVFVRIHTHALKLSDDYFNEKGRRVYITPTRFTENFGPFSRIIQRKTKSIDEERETYIMGIKKLEEANMIVDGMKAQLEELKPILDQKTKDLERIMVNLERETKEVEAAKAIVDQEAQVVYEQRDLAEGIKNECQTRLAEAQPLLDSALNALRTLNVKDFVIMKSFNTPPAPIKLALEAACIMLGIQPKLIEATITKGATKKQVKIADYWEKSKKLLNDYKKFLSSLEHYDKDDIPNDRMHKIQDYLNNPKFVPEEIRKASEAAEGICKWVIAICKYDIIAKEIRPKREALGLAQQKLDVVLQKLREKELELQKIIDQKNKLEEDFKFQNFEKHSLISQRDECQAKLNRASILMGSLSLEKERWIKSTERLLKEKETIIGDSILGSAFITYLGAFEGTYRQMALKNEWRQIILTSQLPLADELNLTSAIGVPVQNLQSWQLKGLPQDSVSVENMIILEESKHQWPLLIDPQGYAVKFLKEYLENDFIAIKVSQNDGGKYLRKLETALFQGSTVICEGFTDTIDQTMQAVVLREIQEVRGEKYIKFNDNQLEFNDRFRFFMVTMQANPHFKPELHTRTRVLNFSVTLEGLEQQLLSVVCRNESTRDEDEKDRLLRQNIEFQEQKRLIEDQILEQLRNSGTDILDDDTLVNSLNDSKKITDDIKHKLSSAKLIEERIEENRKTFKPIACQAAKLYFVVQQMSSLDPMYQFSMKWFRELFVRSFTINEKVKDIKGRVRQLRQDFSKLLYQNVCRCLFEHHKLMFAFNMAIHLHLDDVHGDKESFSRRLKELEQAGISGNVGSAGNQHLQQMAHIKQSVGRVSLAKKSILKSDSTSQAGNTHVLGSFAKNEEEKLKIHKDELHYLLTGLLLSGERRDALDDRANPCEDFIDQKTWQQVCEIASMHQFDTLPDEIERNHQGWKKFVLKSEQPIPEPYYSTLPDFSQIILYKILKPEKTVQMIQRYVSKALGPFFIKPIIHSLDEIFQESKPNIPIILILTPGNDPMEQIKKFGEEKQKIPYPVSLGKGQGEKAKAVINECKQYGGWVVLQNCHLAVSFLPELEQIFEQLQPSTYTSQQPTHAKVTQAKSEEDAKNLVKPPHQEFRMWLTSMSTDAFPFQILSDSIKLTSEPPKGLKASLQRVFNQVESSKAEKEFYNSNPKPAIWRRLFLALSFFHGIVRERRKYGPLGWNLNYDFNDSDFRISMRQLHLMIENFDEVPFRALNYLTGECNYGGRVTDDWDRRTLISILKDFYTPIELDQETQYHFLPKSEEYYILGQGELADYSAYVNGLPDEENPSLVGLHQNASITQAINDSQAILNNIVQVSNKGGSTANNQSNAQAIKMAQEILAQVREPYQVKEVEKLYPFRYEESMNSVLLQELARYNTLIEEVRSSLRTLILTLEGKLVLNQDIERMLTSLMSNCIPDKWRQRSYPSKKLLLSYVKDLCKRLKFLDSWITEGQPKVFWISGFFFTQSFLTGVKQNFARRHKHPIDKVNFTFEVLSPALPNDIAPQNGCYATGLYLEGASWHGGLLQESDPKVLFCPMPPIHFIPTLEIEQAILQEHESSVEHPPQHADPIGDSSLNESASQLQVEEKLYQYPCPVYKTSARAGTLSTTGHSTNYILTCLLPSKELEDHWVKRSVALLTQLDD